MSIKRELDDRRSPNAKRVRSPTLEGGGGEEDEEIYQADGKQDEEENDEQQESDDGSQDDEEENAGHDDASASPRPPSPLHPTDSIMNVNAPDLTGKTTTGSGPPMIVGEGGDIEIEAQHKMAALESTLQRWRQTALHLLPPDSEPDPDKLRSWVLDLKSAHQMLREQFRETKKRESELVMRLTQKEKDIYTLEAYCKEAGEAMESSASSHRANFMDPMVKERFLQLQRQVVELKRALAQSDDNIKAITFSPQTFNGQQLLKKCRALQEENKELGEQVTEGKIAHLELALHNQKKLNEELNKSCTETTGYLLGAEAEMMRQEREIRSLRQQLAASEGNLAGRINTKS